MAWPAFGVDVPPVLQSAVGLVLPWLGKSMSVLLEKTMGVGGAVGLSTAANVFVGMVEAPLVIRPYLALLNRGEFFIVMTCGMASVAGSVMVLYASILGPVP